MSMNENVVFSYSKYATWSQCPKKYEYLYIDKYKEPPSEILEYGNRIHKQMEEYMLLEGMPMPTVVSPLLEAEIKLVKKLKPQVEQWWTLNKDLAACGSWDADVAWRGKVDAYYIVDNKHMTIIDWKTGKVRDKNLEQLDLYAMLGFNLFPAMETIEVALYYLEHGVKLEETYQASDAERITQMWQARLQPFKHAIEFKPNPSPLCGWCSFSRRHFGGPCLAG